MIFKILIFVVLILTSLYFLFPTIFYDLFYFLDFYRSDFKLKKIKVEGNVFSYAEGGKGNDTIVFVHGFQGEKRAWLNYAKNFSSDYKIILVDLPAHGKSSFKNIEKFDFSSFANFLNKFLKEKKNLKDFFLVGTSLGGGVSMEYASRYPHFLKKLILINPIGIKPEKEELEKMVKKNEILFFPKNLKELDALYIYLSGKVFIRKKMTKKYILKRLIKKRKIFKKIFSDISKDDGVEKKLKDIKTPILLLVGTLDNILRKKDFEIYKNNFQNCNAIKIEGHHIFINDAFKKALFHMKKFLKN